MLCPILFHWMSTFIPPSLQGRLITWAHTSPAMVPISYTNYLRTGIGEPMQLISQLQVWSWFLECWWVWHRVIIPNPTIKLRELTRKLGSSYTPSVHATRMIGHITYHRLSMHKILWDILLPALLSFSVFRAINHHSFPGMPTPLIPQLWTICLSTVRRSGHKLIATWNRPLPPASDSSFVIEGKHLYISLVIEYIEVLASSGSVAVPGRLRRIWSGGTLLSPSSWHTGPPAHQWFSCSPSWSACSLP